MSRVISPVTGKPYGLAAVCRVWRLARSGVYRHLCAPAAALVAQRRGPLGAMSDDALTTAIQGVLAARPDVRVRHQPVEVARLEVSSKAFCNATGVAPATEPIPRH